MCDKALCKFPYRGIQPAVVDYAQVQCLVAIFQREEGHPFHRTDDLLREDGDAHIGFYKRQGAADGVYLAEEVLTDIRMACPILEAFFHAVAEANLNAAAQIADPQALTLSQGMAFRQRNAEIHRPRNR